MIFSNIFYTTNITSGHCEPAPDAAPSSLVHYNTNFGAKKNGQNHVVARKYMKYTQTVFILNKHEFWRELLPKSGIHSILRIHKSDLQRFEIGGVLARECGRNGTL